MYIIFQRLQFSYFNENNQESLKDNDVRRKISAHLPSKSRCILFQFQYFHIILLSIDTEVIILHDDGQF
jgi:hypothetical protein